jgi:hypothetical protein
MKTTIVRLAAAGLIFLSIGAQAQNNIVYQVDRAFGGGTVIGSIETDGTLGSLSVGNIVSWSFEGNDGVDVISISSASGGFPLGTAWKYLTATPTTLSFDFDGAYADPDPSVEFIAFVGSDDQVPYTASYNLLGNAFGKIEQFVHQFGAEPETGEHRIDSPTRSGDVVIARSEAADCSAPRVSLGEVMAGFQSGIVAGINNEYGPAGDYFMAASGENRRGFIVPEAAAEYGLGRSAQCENDFILISGYVGATIALPDGSQIRMPKEAIDAVSAGLNGFVVYQQFELDGALVEHMNTAPKIGYLPNGRRAALIASGFIIEPYSLSQGNHSAVLTYGLDLDCRPSRGGVCDGVADFDLVYVAPFFINPANQ